MGGKSKGLTKIFFGFLTVVMVYGVAVFFFTSIVHGGGAGDEGLYLELAKSFHYKGKFECQNQLKNYSCILYSMLISVAYYFYSPRWILFIMRMIGVVAMSSSIFPLYFLAKDVYGEEKKAVKVGAFMMLMPYMLDTAYIMQEVLSYPLFLWAVYLLYRAFGAKDDIRSPAGVSGGGKCSVFWCRLRKYIVCRDGSGFFRSVCIYKDLHVFYSFYSQSLFAVLCDQGR